MTASTLLSSATVQQWLFRATLLTTPMTLAEMIGFSTTVVRGTTRPLVVVDMPFGTYLTIDDTLRNAARLVQEGGASAVKLEVGRSQAAESSRPCARRHSRHGPRRTSSADVYVESRLSPRGANLDRSCGCA